MSNRYANTMIVFTGCYKAIADHIAQEEGKVLVKRRWEIRHHLITMSACRAA